MSHPLTLLKEAGYNWTTLPNCDCCGRFTTRVDTSSRGRAGVLICAELPLRPDIAAALSIEALDHE